MDDANVWVFFLLGHLACLGPLPGTEILFQPVCSTDLPNTRLKGLDSSLTNTTTVTGWYMLGIVLNALHNLWISPLRNRLRLSWEPRKIQIKESMSGWERNRRISKSRQATVSYSSSFQDHLRTALIKYVCLWQPSIPLGTVHKTRWGWGKSCV